MAIHLHYNQVQHEDTIFMAKDAVISARIDPKLKARVEKVLHELGMTTSQAITMFCKQVELQRGLPFSVRIPNKATRQALEEARTRRNLKEFNTVEDLLEDLGIR